MTKQQQRLPRKLKKKVKKLFKNHSSHWAKRMSMKILVNYKELLLLDWSVFKIDKPELPKGFERYHFKDDRLGISFDYAVQLKDNALSIPFIYAEMPMPQREKHLLHQLLNDKAKTMKLSLNFSEHKEVTYEEVIAEVTKIRSLKLLSMWIKSEILAIYVNSSFDSIKTQIDLDLSDNELSIKLKDGTTFKPRAYFRENVAFKLEGTYYDYAVLYQKLQDKIKELKNGVTVFVDAETQKVINQRRIDAIIRDALNDKNNH